jgi:hypothetical protein
LAADLDKEPLARLLVPGLLLLLFVGLEEAQPAAFRLSIQPGHCPAQAERLVPVEAQPIGDHGCQQGLDWRTVDQDDRRFPIS